MHGLGKEESGTKGEAKECCLKEGAMQSVGKICAVLEGRSLGMGYRRSSIVTFWAFAGLRDVRGS